MKQGQTDRVFLSISLIGFILMSISVLLVPIEHMRVLPGLLFWSGLLLGVVFQIVLESRRKAFFARYRVNRKKMQKPRNGLLTFASNKVASVVDNSLIVSIVATIIAIISTKGSGYICYICIAAVLLTFSFHCVLNGRNYFHVQNIDKIRQVLEQKKVNTERKGERKNEDGNFSQR